jgi:hypothetical protein
MDESEKVYDLCARGDGDSKFSVLKAYLERYPDVKVDLYRDALDWTALHRTSARKSPSSTELLLDHKADINARTKTDYTSLTLACLNEGNEDTALLLIERGADIHQKDSFNREALHFSIFTSAKSTAFTLLCCGSDVKEVKISANVTRTDLTDCIEDYKKCHEFIETYCNNLQGTLSHAIFQEPLERVLEYCGLSMRKNQTVNTSIDGQGAGGVKRVLIPNQARNAKHWYDLYKQYLTNFNN